MMINRLKDYADRVAKKLEEKHMTVSVAWDIENTCKSLDGKINMLCSDMPHIRTTISTMSHDIKKLQQESELRRRVSRILIWATGIIVAVMVCAFASLAHASNMIIGDSHVGGLKPYLNKHMIVRYKNGSTSSYWLRRPTYPVDKLIVHTGTNEQFNGTSAKKWLDQTISLCWRWNPRKCYIVAPPANRRGNYRAYRSILYSQRNIIYTQSDDMRDAVHYKPSGYKRMAFQILSVIRAN
jgi:hypothetical protein